MANENLFKKLVDHIEMLRELSIQESQMSKTTQDKEDISYYIGRASAFNRAKVLLEQILKEERVIR